jgi:hypothetical protein
VDKSRQESKDADDKIDFEFAKVWYWYQKVVKDCRNMKMKEKRKRTSKAVFYTAL